MLIIADSLEFARKASGKELVWQKKEQKELPPEIRKLSSRLVAKNFIYTSKVEDENYWKYMFAVEEAAESQYDVLTEMARNTELPDGILCIAGSGSRFHGFRNRHWSAVAGNIHLSLLFSPKQKIDGFGVGFIALPAVSVLDTADSFDDLSGRANIKWVNDILIDGAKVCGFLAHTQAQGEEISSAVLGIGLNVETKPNADINAYVPQAACLNDFIGKKISMSDVLNRLIDHLKENYLRLLDGNYKFLADRYISRSLVIGKEVTITGDNPNGDDSEIVSGKVSKIGDNLELYIEGRDQAIINGRLILK